MTGLNEELSLSGENEFALTGREGGRVCEFPRLSRDVIIIDI
jgi:hypothetical protein